MENFGRKITRGLIWYTTVPFLVHLVRFANSIILARILVPKDFGIISIVSVILYYCDSFSDFGFGKALIQRQQVSDAHFSSYFCFNLFVSICFFVLSQFLAKPIASFYEIPELLHAVQIFAFLFLITAFSAAPRIQLTRDVQFKTLALIEAAKVSASIGISLTLALNGFGFWSIIYAMLGSRMLSLLLLMGTSNLRLKLVFSVERLKELMSFGIWDFISGQTRLLADSVDKLVIGKVLGAFELGFYDRAIGLARMPNDQLSNRIGQISFASLSRIQSEPEEFEYFFWRLLIVKMAVLLPIFGGLFWVAESLTNVLLGSKWLPIVPTLKLFCISYVVLAIGNAIYNVNLALGNIKQQTVLRILCTSILLPCFFIVAKLGIAAVAATIIIYNALMFLGSYVLLQWHTKYQWKALATNLLPILFVVTCMILVLAIVEQRIAFESDVIELIALSSIGAVSYLVFLLTLPFRKLKFLRQQFRVALVRFVRRNRA